MVCSSLLSVLGYSVRCAHKHVFYHHLHELLKPGGQCPLPPPSRLCPVNGPSVLYLMTHHSIILHPEGERNQASHPGYKLRFLKSTWSLFPLDFPEDKSYIPITGPSEEHQIFLHRITASTEPHPFTSGGLQPPPYWTAAATQTNRVRSYLTLVCLNQFCSLFCLPLYIY